MRGIKKYLREQVEDNAKPYLNSNAVMCGIGVIDKSDSSKAVHSCNIIGELFVENNERYVI